MTMKLSHEQAAFRSFVQSNENVLLIGPGGTGKTHAIGDGMGATLTASTGVATTCLSGPAQTLHRFIGLGILGPNVTFLGAWAKLKTNKEALTRIRSTRRLLIDEISMVKPRLLVVFDLLCRVARGQLGIPFGGIQIILVGDFLQLPPVHRGNEEVWPAMMVFEVFDSMRLYMRRVDLTQVFRQQDPRLLAAVQDARNGFVSDRTLGVFRECVGREFPDDGVEPTSVFTRKHMVQQENARQMHSKPNKNEFKRLTFRAHVLYCDVERNEEDDLLRYVHRSAGASTRQKAASALNAFLENQSHRSQEVRTDMQVIFTYNVHPESGVANGTRGVVRGWVRLPLDQAHQVLTPISPALFLTHGHRDPLLVPDGEGPVLPVVFISRGRKLFVVQYMDIELPSAFEERDQANPRAIRQCFLLRIMPFMAGWALTIHRTQGATIDRLRWHLPSNAMPSAGYVVVSRVRDLASLSIDKPPEKKHFWTQKVARRHFGPRTAHAALGHVWIPPEVKRVYPSVAKDIETWRRQMWKVKLPKWLAEAGPVPSASVAFDQFGKVRFKPGFVPGQEVPKKRKILSLDPKRKKRGPPSQEEEKKKKRRKKGNGVSK